MDAVPDGSSNFHHFSLSFYVQTVAGFDFNSRRATRDDFVNAASGLRK